MTDKPKSLSRAKILAFGLALVAAGYFAPIYKIAESVFGVEETANIFKWILAAKESQENPPVVTPDVPEAPTDNESLLVDDLDISGGIEVCKNPKNNVGAQRIPATHKLESVRWSGSHITFKNDMPESWRNRSIAKEQGFIRCYVAWKEGASVYMSHFDWADKHTKKETKNLYNGYLTRRPIGELYYFFVSNDGKNRTNILKGE